MSAPAMLGTAVELVGPMDKNNFLYLGSFDILLKDGQSVPAL
jgi:hypothetical protein